MRTFATVAELGQLTRAGEALHVSQPAITAQIKALEDELQLELFERTSSGMLLTRAGESLLDHAEIVLAAAQALKNQAKTLSGLVAGKISLGTVADPEFIRLGELLKVMLERFPLVELELHQRVSGHAFEDVRNGALNASFYFGDLNNPNVTGLRLSDLVYCVAAPAAWHDRVEAADWTDIAALPWIFAPPVSTHNQLLHKLFRNQGAVPTKVVEADQESVINSLIESGVGLSLMREDQARAAEAASKVVVWGKERLNTALWFIYPAEHAHDPAMVALIEAVRETWSLKAKAEKASKATRQTTSVR
ncbi:MAG: LysR family transcriptional regulator [Burkholderiales bacterium]|nr:LysR family transcriptional regulator [Pseudomonadota bacterium]